MEYRDRATSLMKQKDEMNVSYLKNRGTIKTKIIEDSKISEEEEKGDKRTLVKVQKPQQILMNDEMEEREYSNYNDPSLMDSPQSMRSVISMNERKHLDFNIKKMIELIENCCSNPLKQVECMVELFKGVDFILNHEGFWPEIFKCDLNDRHSRLKLAKDMDYFLHNSLILIENQEQLRASLLSIIANMAVINYPPKETLGLKCLQALKELINNDNPMVKNIVINTLKNVIVPLVKKKEFLKISFNILNGVNLILTNSSNKEGTLFEPELMSYGAEWLLQIKCCVEKVKDADDFREYFYNSEEFSYHEVILNNLTMKNEFAKYLLEMIHTQILPLETLFSLFETFSQWKATFKVEEDDKYKLKLTVFERTMSLLQIIINISPFLSLNSDYKNQVSEFITHSLERKIEILIKDFYLKSDSYYSGNPHKDETMIQDFQMYYQSLSTKIIAYSSLLRFKEITIFEFKEEAIYKTCASQVLNLIMYHKMNPIILKSCSIFLYNLFKHPNVEYATSDLKIHINIAGSLIDFLPILWFIGGINYETLCMMGSLYTKPIMSELDEVEFYDVGEQRVPQIQECFFYVIKVIKFFSNYKYQSLKATKTAQFCTELCQKVNFIKERNMALFKVWEMPNDNVKLMVCRTFSSLYPGIWTLEDVMFFREILREMKTFRRKNTDEMIAELFLIFSKILMYFKHGMVDILSDIIDLCFEILLNNMERNFKDLHEMNRRKIQISVSCIYFLKRASSIDELHNYFLSPKILFLTKRFFYYEEKYMSETMTPLLLEDTWACSNIEHLLQSTAGNDQIQANSLLGFRLISRIADILQNKILVQSDEDQDVLEKEFSEEEEKQEEESEVFNYWFSPKPSILITRIQKFFEKNFINKIKNELSTWNQIHKNSFLGNFSKAMKNVKKDDNLKNKNYNEEELTINGQQIVYRLAMFVLMKEKNFQIKNDNSKKTSLSQKLDEFLKDFYKEKLAKEKPTIYEQMNMRNPLEFDSKKLRGKEYLEIVYQGLALSKERDLLSKYRNQFFDVNNSLFLDLTSSENFIKNKSDSPLKKRVIFELMDSTDSVEKSPYSNVNEKSSMKPKINLGNVLVGNKDILNKKGVEKLLETLSNNDFEEIINEVFASSKIY